MILWLLAHSYLKGNYRVNSFTLGEGGRIKGRLESWTQYHELIMTELASDPWIFELVASLSLWCGSSAYRTRHIWEFSSHSSSPHLFRIRIYFPAGCLLIVLRDFAVFAVLFLFIQGKRRSSLPRLFNSLFFAIREHVCPFTG